MMTAAENTDIYIQEMFYSTTFIWQRRLLVTLQMMMSCLATLGSINY